MSMIECYFSINVSRSRGLGPPNLDLNFQKKRSAAGRSAPRSDPGFVVRVDDPNRHYSEFSILNSSYFIPSRTRRQQAARAGRVVTQIGSAQTQAVAL